MPVSFGLLNNTNPGLPVLRVLSEINRYTTTMTIIILVALCSLALLFAIYIGFKFATAKDDNARAQAKLQLFYSLVAALSIGILTAVYQLMLGTDVTRQFILLPSEVGPFRGINFDCRTCRATDPPTPWTGCTHGAPIAALGVTYTNMYHLIITILNVLTTVSVLFAVYLAWKLAKAEDDNTRKQAKFQIFYSVMGVFVIVLIIAVTQAVIGSLGK